jgi:hypothetical protein
VHQGALPLKGLKCQRVLFEHCALKKIVNGFFVYNLYPAYIFLARILKEGRGFEKTLLRKTFEV